MQNNDELMSKFGGKLIYLASPFYSESVQERAIRAYQARDIATGFIARGLYAYSPVAYTQSLFISDDAAFGLGYAAWKEMSRRFVEACDIFMVLTIDGWEQSEGVADELAYARLLGKPVFYCRPFGAGQMEFLSAFNVEASNGEKDNDR